MGRESTTLNLLTPKRTLTPEILTELYIACGYEGIHATLEHIDKLTVRSPGILEIYVDSVYDEEPIDKVIKEHDLAVLMEIGASYDGPASTYMYVPTTSKHHNGRLHNVDLDFYNSPFVPLSVLEGIYTRFGNDPTKMTKHECVNMINEIRDVMLANTPDPNDVLNEFAFETKLGRDSSKTREIQDVLEKLDKGLITQDQAMEQIKGIKEG